MTGPPRLGWWALAPWAVGVVAVVGTAYYGLVLRRLDTLDTRDDEAVSKPSR